MAATKSMAERATAAVNAERLGVNGILDEGAVLVEQPSDRRRAAGRIDRVRAGAAEVPEAQPMMRRIEEILPFRTVWMPNPAS